MPASGGHPPTPKLAKALLDEDIWLWSCERFKDFAAAASDSHAIAKFSTDGSRHRAAANMRFWTSCILAIGFARPAHAASSAGDTISVMS
ncbi:hypothetical protein [Sphingomonas echinoides]|uniref:hypothetical protein n=1 Tax=Sphingomonas echinoides TaxID=59803 RepID=UPI003F4B58A8